MSARVVTICLATVLLLGAGSLSNAVYAKPPGLPVDLQVDCEIEPEVIEAMPTEIEVLDVMPRPVAEGRIQETYPANFVQGLTPEDSEDLEAGPAGDETLQAIMAQEAEANAVLGRIGYWGGNGADSWEFSLNHPELLTGRVQLGGGRIQDSDHHCPYLKQLAQEAEAPAKQKAGLVPSLLENLAKLSQSRKAYRTGQRYFQNGDMEAARCSFEIARHLCPGSRYDRLATKRLEELQAAQEAEAAEAEAEEQSATSMPIEAQVAELLESCQRALVDGRLVEARNLAEQAQALDPGCAAANALVIKTHLLTHLHEMRHAAAGEEASSCPPAAGQSLASPEQKPSAAEREIEFLFGPRDSAKSMKSMATSGDIGSAGRSCCGCQAASLLQQVCAAIREANGFDVDISKSGCLRFRYSFQLGKLEFCFGRENTSCCAIELAIPGFLPTCDMRWWLPHKYGNGMKASDTKPVESSSDATGEERKPGSQEEIED